MATNVNVYVSSENDGTRRNNVNDYLIHFSVNWIDGSGTYRETEADEYFLLLINWLRTTHPNAAKNVMEELAFKIARVKYGLDDAEMMG